MLFRTTRLLIPTQTDLLLQMVDQMDTCYYIYLMERPGTTNTTGNWKPKKLIGFFSGEQLLTDSVAATVQGIYTMKPSFATSLFKRKHLLASSQIPGFVTFSSIQWVVLLPLHWKPECFDKRSEYMPNGSQEVIGHVVIKKLGRH